MVKQYGRRGIILDYKKKMSNLSTKQMILAISIIFVCVLTIGSTMSLLKGESNSVINIFQRADMSCQVVEEFDGEIKRNVCVENTSTQDDISGYIRVAVIASWQDANGNVYGKQPLSGTDYTISYGDGWDNINGYYYWPEAVVAGGKTGILINSCREVEGMAPEGYALAIDVVAEIIQSNPKSAVLEAWEYDPDKTGGQ